MKVLAIDPATGSDVLLASFAYDALERKITAWTKYDGAADSETSDLRFYHDGQVELADYNASDGSLARRFVNGTQYIDERAVLIEGQAGDNGAPVDAETFYYLTQELYTVTGLMKVNGTLTEAGTFDGYGAVRLWHYSDGDFNRDGAVNATDQTRFTAAMGVSSGVPAKDPLADLDLDGDVDLTDSAAFTTIKNSGGAMSQLFTSAAGNPFHFTGRRLYMLETLPESDTTSVANQQLQHNRARHYSALEGRWLQRDSLRHADSMNLYEYTRSMVMAAFDPRGRESVPCGQFDSPGFNVFPPYRDWVPNWDDDNYKTIGIGGFCSFGAHWLDLSGRNLHFPEDSSYSNWLDSTKTVERLKTSIANAIRLMAIAKAKTLPCNATGKACFKHEESAPFNESPCKKVGTDWFSIGNIHVIAYSVCNLSKKCCQFGTACNLVTADCTSMFIAHDSFHFGFPGRPFFWHAKLSEKGISGWKYYGPDCPKYLFEPWPKLDDDYMNRWRPKVRCCD